MASPTTLDVVTLGIAGVGATTGILALGATWAQFKLSGPKIKVTAGTAMPTTTKRFLVYISVENVGRMPLTLHGLGLSLPKKRHVPLAVELAHGRGMGPDLPHRLEVSDTESWYFETDGIVTGLRKQRLPVALIAFAQSDSNRTFAKQKVDLAQIEELNRGGKGRTL